VQRSSVRANNNLLRGDVIMSAKDNMSDPLKLPLFIKVVAYLSDHNNLGTSDIVRRTNCTYSYVHALMKHVIIPAGWAVKSRKDGRTNTYTLTETGERVGLACRNMISAVKLRAEPQPDIDDLGEVLVEQGRDEVAETVEMSREEMEVAGFAGHGEGEVLVGVKEKKVVIKAKDALDVPEVDLGDGDELEVS